MKLLRFAFLAVTLLATTALTTEQKAERQMQDTLPQSKDDLWKLLGKCKVHQDKKTFTYSIDYTPEVKAMEGKPFTISGFMLPLESKEKFTHYLLSKRTPTCPFCPPGEPNEIVEVFSKKPVEWDENLVVVTGTMKFTANPELGLFFQMKDAEMADLKTPPEKKPAF